jgi:hypothetical protein
MDKCIRILQFARQLFADENAAGQSQYRLAGVYAN